MNILTPTQFQALYGLSDDFSFLMKKVENSYVYIYINDAAKPVFESDPIGMPIHFVLKDQRLEEVMYHYNLALRLNKVVTYRDTFLFSGETQMNETTVTPIFSDDEQYILAITKDVSKQMETEEKFLFFQSLMSASNEPMIIVKTDGAILEMNPMFERVFGYSFKHWKGKNISTLPFTIGNDDSFEEKMEAGIKGKSISSFICKKRKSDLSVGTFLTSISPIELNGTTVAISILLHEITEHVNLEKELLITRSDLESYKRAIDEIAMVMLFDETGFIHYVNRRFEDKTGFGPEQMNNLNRNAFEVLKLEEQMADHMRSLMNDGQIWTGEMKGTTKNNHSYYADSVLVPLLSEEGVYDEFLLLQFDVTDKKEVMDGLRRIEDTFRLITDHSSDLITIVDSDLRIVYLSRSHEEKLGYGNEELLGTYFQDLLNTVDKQEFNSTYLAALHEGEHILVEFELFRKDGTSFWTETSITPVGGRLGNDTEQFVIISREITERKKKEENLTYLAFHDSLTGLPNRRFFDQEIPGILERAKELKTAIGVLFIDGDDFKSVNDQYGHDVGDLFLTRFAHSLDECIRTNDLVARFGGDEFVIILQDLPLHHDQRILVVKKVIDRLYKRLREGWTIGYTEFRPNASIGISFYPEHGTTIDELLEVADRALYDAKNSNKGSYLYEL